MQNKMLQSQIIWLFVLLVIAGGIYYVAQPKSMPSITSFEECAAAGYPIMESYPEQCRTPDGRNFVRVLPPETNNAIPPQDGLGLQANGCAVAGCSGQLCVSADEAAGIVTTCEYRSEYGCYKEASCEKQADGQCGWSQTAELSACLRNPPAPEAGVEMPQ